MISPRVTVRLLAGLLALSFLSCDSTNPVAPNPDEPQPPAAGNFNVGLTAVPTELQAGSAEPATVTVEVTKTSDNLPPADGTAVALNTSLGSFGVNDASNPVRSTTLTLTGGRAQVSLFPGADTGTAQVLAQVGENTGRLSVQVLAALPSNFFVSGVVPNSGDPDGGEPVTVQGAGFEEPVRVTFGGVQATVRSVSSSAIEVDTPRSAQPVEAGGFLTVDVAVTNDLSSGEPPMDTLTGGFTYTLGAAPAFFVQEVDPPRGPAAGGTAITVRGQGFRAPIRLEMGGVVVTGATLVSDTEIQATTPPAAQTVPAGTSLAVDVTVTNALGSETSSSAVLVGGFTYFEEAPEPPGPIVIESLSPTEGPIDGGTVVTITGSGFPAGEPVAVELAGVRQRAESVVDGTTIRFTTAGIDEPAQCPVDGRVAQRGVTVTFPASGTSGDSGDVFTYLLTVPRISRVSGTGQQTGSTIVIDGQGFGDEGSVDVRVDLVAGGETFATQVTQATPTRITIRTPRFADDFFPEQDCVTDVSTQGRRFVERTVDVVVTNLDNGCADTAGGALTIFPSDTRCRETEPPPP